MSEGSAAGAREAYTVGYGAAAHERHAGRTAERHAAWLKPHLRPGMRLLDCGCGPGSITLDLATLVAPAEVVGVDISPLQAARATALARRCGCETARFAVADLYALPFQDGSFDAVLAHAVLAHLREPLRALKEIRRVLAPGGIAGICDDGGLFFEPATPLLERYLALREQVKESQLGRPELASSRRQRQWLRLAGFERTEGVAFVESFGTPEQTGAYARFRVENSRAAEFQATAIGLGVADEAMLDAICAELLAWGERSDAFAAIVWCAAIGWR